jgi:hypothetical protein
VLRNHLRAFKMAAVAARQLQPLFIPQPNTQTPHKLERKISKTGRRQHRSCDQCRKGKRACDATILDPIFHGEDSPIPSSFTVPSPNSAQFWPWNGSLNENNSAGTGVYASFHIISAVYQIKFLGFGTQCGDRRRKRKRQLSSYRTMLELCKNWKGLYI